MYEFKTNPQTPNLVIIGNIAYDIVDFTKVDERRSNLIDIGGACIFTSIPASMFHRVGIVGKIGNDLDISKFYGYNIDLSGIKKLDMPTTRFYTIWNTSDGQDRTVAGQVDSLMEVGCEDIPPHFLGAKHFHLTTARPEKQLELIEFLRQHTDATISVDTIDEFVEQPKCKDVFDKVDIAFIDKEYTRLLDCKAKKKVIKYGKSGCLFHSDEKSFPVHSQVIEDVVDKTGAGDCLNGVFLNLIINGTDEKTALRTAVDVATESIKHRGIMDFKLPTGILRMEEKEHE